MKNNLLEKKAEEMLGIEQKVIAVGQLLDSEGRSVEYFLKKYGPQTPVEKPVLVEKLTVDKITLGESRLPTEEKNNAELSSSDK